MTARRNAAKTFRALAAATTYFQPTLQHSSLSRPNHFPGHHCGRVEIADDAKDAAAAASIAYYNTILPLAERRFLRPRTDADATL